MNQQTIPSTQQQHKLQTIVFVQLIKAYLYVFLQYDFRWY